MAKRSSHKWTPEQRTKYAETVSKKRRAREENMKKESAPKVNPVPTPDVIFVLLNGKMERFVLRTMAVYVPASSLDLNHTSGRR